jgi:hypothetical protein
MQRNMMTIRNRDNEHFLATGTPVLVRLEEGFLEGVNLWRASQPDHPTLAEAVHRLAVEGLAGQTD